MRIVSFLAPVTLSVLLVACDPVIPAPDKDAMMDGTGMMKEDTMMKDDEGMMNEDKSAMNDEGMMKEEKIMEDDKMMEENESMNDGAMMHAATYSAYSPAVLNDGKTKVLFFHAAWCPTCRAADASLTSWYNANMGTYNTYKVDYDAEAALKSRYGVTYQHTFVLVDGEGNAITTIQGPSDAQLQDLIGA